MNSMEVKEVIKLSYIVKYTVIVKLIFSLFTETIQYKIFFSVVNENAAVQIVFPLQPVFRII